MDKELKEIISLAKKRGSRYIKKDYSFDEFVRQMAELGVYLLAEHDRIQAPEMGSKRIEELNEIQQRLDHFRRVIFSLKRKIMQ